jgi:hypothetical protein
MKLMRVLLTNISIANGSGTETAILDLAIALRRRGHTVICFAPVLGRLAERIRSTGTPVVDSIEKIGEAPDIIHGHHSGPTMIAMARFRDVPSIFVCHDWSSIHDDPPIHPRIRRYAYVRHVLRERLISEKGISPNRVIFLNNAVDLDRLGPPRTTPARLRTAGLYAHAGTTPFIDALADGCSAQGLSFLGDLLADPANRDRPEKMLAGCDVVFASGRMAIEALVAGYPVINTDRFGVGGLVTGSRFDEFLAANFAIGALSSPASAELIADTLNSYDPSDAAKVATQARRVCDAATVAEKLEQIYRIVLSEFAQEPVSGAAEAVAFARYLEAHLQNGALYNGEFARKRFAPGDGDELARAVELLSLDVKELTRHTRRLARGRINGALTDGWRGILNFFRT